MPHPDPSPLLIATRESRLALWQAEHVRALLKQRLGLDVGLLGMTTRGDQILDRTLSKVGGKGLFVKELETALEEGRAHLAVHSLKDMPMDLPDGFELAAVLEREDPRDALVSNRYATLAKEYGPPGVVNNTFTQSSALFAAGGAAMELESSNEISSINDPKTSKVTGKIGVVDFPAGSAGSKSTVLNWGIAMSSFSKNKDAAWKFIEWATGKATQLKLTAGGIAPPRASVAQDPAYTGTLNTETLKQWSAALANVQRDGSTEVGPVGVSAPEMRKVVGDAVGKAILGQTDAAGAAKEIQDGLTPLLAKNAS
jgi:hypothetical protein